MSEERRLSVLRAIVEDYVRTQDPVGSKALGERHNLKVSPATIRNDMAHLEAEGLITQPHTSAGRIPTDKGYRLFVDRIAAVKPLSTAERRAIAALIADPVDLDGVLERTVRALAQLTQQVAMVQYPSVSTDTVRHVDLITLADGRLLLVLITNTGRVEQRPIVLPQPLPAETLGLLQQRLLAASGGRSVQDLGAVVGELQESFPAAQHDAVGAVLAATVAALSAGREERVVMAGTANLTRSGTDAGSLGPILELIEEQVVLLRLVSEMADDPEMGVSVRIGSENHHEGLATSSVVSSGYGAGDVTARLAVLGPTRMDYPTTMAAVRAVARYVSRIITPVDDLDADPPGPGGGSH